MLKKIWQIIDRHPSLFAFILVSVILLISNLSQAPFRFYADSQEYWNKAATFSSEGGFSYLNFSDQIRGYLFPFILYLFQQLGSLLGMPGELLYEIGMSLVYSVFLTGIVPGFLRAVFHKKTGFVQTMLFSLIGIWFWRGSFFYPLTDVPAFLFMVAGTLVAFSNPNRWYAIPAAGLLWGGSLLIRPAYEITIPFLLLWAIYFYRKELRMGLVPILLRMVLLLAGFGIIFAPQVAVNLKYSDTFSPLPPAKTKWGNLAVAQLSWGITVQKIETDIGSGPRPYQVIFPDLRGVPLMVGEGYLPYDKAQIWLDPVLTLPEYVALVIRHPVDFAVIYVRHLFNGLNISYNTPYITDVYRRPFFLQLANYTVWFLVVVCAVLKFRPRKVLDSRFFLPAIFLLPSLLAIPMVIETRFFLPVHFMAYALLAFWVLPEAVKLKLDWKRRKWWLLAGAVLYAAFVVTCFLQTDKLFALVKPGYYY